MLTMSFSKVYVGARLLGKMSRNTKTQNVKSEYISKPLENHRCRESVCLQKHDLHKQG